MGGVWEEQKNDGSKLGRTKGKISNKDKLTNKEWLKRTFD
jgi:hypothetical protein